MNFTCSSLSSCSSCLSATIDCTWCATDSSCIDSSAKSTTCASEIIGSCNDSYYTIIFIVVLSATLCLCCATCYIRRVRQSNHDVFFEQIVSPLLPSRARKYFFHKVPHDVEREWMCIICGFDNKSRNKNCIMCGTSHEFSLEYKRNKLRRRRHHNDTAHAEETLSLLHNEESQVTTQMKNSVSSMIDDPDLSSRSLSLKYFKSSADHFVFSGPPLSAEQRSEAINYRRINQLSLRQKSARRRKMWRRVFDENSKRMVWTRTPLREITVNDITKGSSAPFGFTPRSSISKIDAESASYGKSFARDEKNILKDLLSLEEGNSRVASSNPSESTPKRHTSKDSFGDSVLYSCSPGFTSVFDEDGALTWSKVDSTVPVKPAQLAGKSSGNEAKNFTRLVDGTGSKLIHDVFEFDLSTIAAYTFRDKLSWFLDRMSEIQKPWTEGFVRIEIRRHKILEDSFRAWMQLDAEDLHKWMRYQFRGEAGVDAGGLEREWFGLLCAEIFNPLNGLFIGGGPGGYHINPLSGFVNIQHLTYFRFIGRIFGKAIMQQLPLNANLALPLRKQIVGMPVTFSDLEFVDEELYKNLRWMLNSCEDVSVLSLYFSVTYFSNNNQLTNDLVPNGSEILVTNENRGEYLQLRLKHRLLDSVKSQLENFLIGLYEVVPPDLLSVFDYQEFDLLLCGIPDLDLDDWRRHTEYLGEYSKLGERNQVIRWFWMVVEEMSQEERIRLLHFTTGSSRLPVGGFKALQSTDGKFRKFNVQSVAKSSSVYPRAHTCFNKLDLPMYESRNELEAYLTYVINLEVVGFNME